jgi:hypothetical protein
VRQAPEGDLAPHEHAEVLISDFLRVLHAFRDRDPNAPIAAVAVHGGGVQRITYGDLRDLVRVVVTERARTNRAARDAADVRDLLDAVVSELEDLRERYAELATERDLLSAQLDEAGEAYR